MPAREREGASEGGRERERQRTKGKGLLFGVGRWDCQLSLPMKKAKEAGRDGTKNSSDYDGGAARPARQPRIPKATL